MTRILTNVDSLVALTSLERTNRSLATTLSRISTGTRINSGKDDPGGLITGEFLRQEINAFRSAVANNNRANNALATADAALSRITDLLNDIRGTLVTSVNRGVLSQDEIDANQLSIDQAVLTVNRIAGTTTFAGRKLLDGSLGFQLSGAPRFDSGTSTLTDVRVNLANFSANNAAIAVTITLATAATRASLTLNQATATQDSTIEVVGTRGAITVQVSAGQAVANAINGVSDVTGVTAAGGVLTSAAFGSNAFVTVRNVVGLLLTSSEATALGTNAIGTINGQAFTANGLDATLRSANLDIDVTFSAGAPSGASSAFQITGGGARFQLGAAIDINNQINVGLQSFSSARLGRVFTDSTGLQDQTLQSIATGGANSLQRNRASYAVDIVELVLNQVTSARARIGAVQKNAIEANLNSLQLGIENLSAARSQLVDADFAEETANLTRLQILVQAGQNSLAIANARPQGVLQLLNNQ